MTHISKLFAALLLATCAIPAFAQDPEMPDKIVLEGKIGSVMTSTGGDYESVDLGKLLVRDESMMLSDGAKATVVYYYDNGKRKCTEVYKGPNTFVIDDSCKVAGYPPNNGKGTIAVLAGAAVIGALISGGGSSDPGPISTGRR